MYISFMLEIIFSEDLIEITEIAKLKYVIKN